MRYTINGGVFGRLRGKWGDAAGGPQGWGPPGSGRGGAGRCGDRGGAAGASLQWPSVQSPLVSQLLAPPVSQEQEPRIMSGFVFLRARGLPKEEDFFLFLN